MSESICIYTDPFSKLCPEGQALVKEVLYIGIVHPADPDSLLLITFRVNFISDTSDMIVERRVVMNRSEFNNKFSDIPRADNCQGR